MTTAPGGGPSPFAGRRRRARQQASTNPLGQALVAPQAAEDRHTLGAPTGPPPEDYWGSRSPRWVDAAPPGRILRVHTLEEARDLIFAIALAYLHELDPDRVLLVRATAGVGKSWIAGALCSEMSRLGRFGAYCGPRHDLFGEILAMVVAGGGLPNEWYRWLPHQDDDGGRREATCKFPAHIASVARRHFDTIQACFALKGCGHDYVRRGCPWHGQKEDIAAWGKRIVYIQHQHLVVGHPLSGAFDYVVGDESPLGAVAHAWRIPAGKIYPQDLTVAHAFAPVLRALEALALGGMALWGRALIDHLIGACGGLAALRQGCGEQVGLAGTVKLVASDPDEYHLLDYNHAGELARALGREAEAHAEGIDYAARVVVGPFPEGEDDPDLLLPRPAGWRTDRERAGRRGLTILRRNRIDWRGLGSDKGYPRPMVWFDGTGHAPFYEMLFERPVEELRVEIVAHQRIWQVRDRGNYISQTVADGALTPAGQALVADIARIATQARADGRRVGIVAQRAFLAAAPDVGAYASPGPDGRPLVDHFGAQRGTNTMQGVGTLIVAGTPGPNPASLHDLARCLILERDGQGRLTSEPRRRAFEIGGRLPRELADRAYRWADPAGGSWVLGVPGYSSDPDLDRLYWQLREAEALQSLGRGRGVLCSPDAPVQIWLLTNLPLDVDLFALITRAELHGAPDGVDDPVVWPIVVAAATEIGHRIGYVLSTDLIAALAERGTTITPKTARKYVDLLGAHEPAFRIVGPDEAVALLRDGPPRGRGRPPTHLVGLAP